MKSHNFFVFFLIVLSIVEVSSTSSQELKTSKVELKQLRDELSQVQFIIEQEEKSQTITENQNKEFSKIDRPDIHSELRQQLVEHRQRLERLRSEQKELKNFYHLKQYHVRSQSEILALKRAGAGKETKEMMKEANQIAAETEDLLKDQYFGKKPVDMKKFQVIQERAKTLDGRVKKLQHPYFPGRMNFGARFSRYANGIKSVARPTSAILRRS